LVPSPPFAGKAEEQMACRSNGGAILDNSPAAGQEYSTGLFIFPIQ